MKTRPTLAALAMAVLFAPVSTPVLAQEPAESAGCGDAVTCLEQGWNEAERIAWYTTSQGSRLLPLSWALALERPGAIEKLMSAANMTRLGYLPGPVSARNPQGLPLGFAVDHDPSSAADIMCDTFPATCDNRTMRQPWVGMTCSACHTNDIAFAGHTIRVEGAPTLADFETFLAEMADGLDETLRDETKFNRFAQAVLGNAQTFAKRQALRDQLAEHLAWNRRLEDKNNGAVATGKARLDAQSHILNKVALIASPSGPGETPDPQPTEIKADAPASYPFVWNTSQQVQVQWNGIASNILRFTIFGNDTDIGSLVRNTSEVIGVFAHIELARRTDWLGYNSSLRLQNMVGLERQLARLQSPRWPADILPAIDWAKAERGDVLFEQHCASCHAHLDADDLVSPAREQMQPIADGGTDIFLACNTFLHTSNAYRFEGRRPFIYPVPGVKNNGRIRSSDVTRAMLINATVGAIVGEADELVETILRDTFNGGRDILTELPQDADLREYLPGVTDQAKKDRAKICLNTEDPILAYKARPLNGIWATAPYLHNGSVPTLYDLLLPAKVRNVAFRGDPEPDFTGIETRPETFHVGSRVFDPVKVGFVSEPGEGTFEFRVRDAQGQPIPGNYNSGHDYGVDELTEEQRWELVEYLKTL